MENKDSFDLGQIAFGQLDVNGTPYINVRVVGNEKWITAAIDTGAFKNAVIPYFLNHTPLQIVDSEFQNFVSDGLIEVDVYKIEFEIEGIKDYVFKDEVIGSPSTYTHQVLIGSKFLSKCKEFRVYLDKGIFELKL